MALKGPPVPAKRILYIDDRVPRDVLGAGLPRSRQIVLGLRQLGHLMSVYPVLEQAAVTSHDRSDLGEGVGILRRWPGTGIVHLLREKGAGIDIIWISRLHNIVHVMAMLSQCGESLRSVSDAALVFDSEAVVAIRECSRAVLSRKPILSSQLQACLGSEADIYRGAGRVVCVSRRDQRMLADFGITETSILGHALDVDRATCGFGERSGVVLVGNLLAKGSPNHVSAEWFVRHVWPLVRRRPGAPATLRIVGAVNIDIAAALRGEGVEVLGAVPDLAPILNEARVAIAPTRFAGGLPHKVHEAMSRGLPVVITSILAEQIGVLDPSILVADDPPCFADAVCRLHLDEGLWLRARRAGWETVARDCSRADFLRQLQHICDPAA